MATRATVRCPRGDCEAEVLLIERVSTVTTWTLHDDGTWEAARHGGGAPWHRTHCKAGHTEIVHPDDLGWSGELQAVISQHPDG